MRHVTQEILDRHSTLPKAQQYIDLIVGSLAVLIGFTLLGMFFLVAPLA